MQPTEGFWGGVGQAVGSSPGWMVVAAILVIGMLFIIAKYIWPSRERINMRKLDIREREAQNDSDRIKANAAMAEQMAALRSSNEQIAQRFAEANAGIEESKARSREMGGEVSDTNRTVHAINSTTEDTNRKVNEMHVQMHDLYGMLNKRKGREDAERLSDR